MQYQFQSAGISIYSQKVEDYGMFKLNFIVTPLVGDAVIDDLIKCVSRGAQSLDEYSKEMKKLTDKKVEQVQSLQKTSPIRSFFAKIRNFFAPAKPEYMGYTREETEGVISHLSDYREIDNQLWKYNLRDSIIPSLVNEIRELGYHADGLPGLLQECVIPDLEKLGLADLIPQLQQELVEEYKKDLPDPEIYQVKEEDLYLYVPDFNRKTEDKGEVDHLEELYKKVETVMDKMAEGQEAIRSLKQNGIELCDFSLVDKTVSASDRQFATSAIGEELHPIKEKDPNKTQENADIPLK